MISELVLERLDGQKDEDSVNVIGDIARVKQGFLRPLD